MGALKIMVVWISMKRDRCTDVLMESMMLLMFVDVWWCLLMFVGVWWWLVMFDDDWWCLMMFDDAWWCLMMMDYAWWCLMMFDDVWWRLMMFDDGWWCLMIFDVWYLMMFDDDWWWLIMLDDAWWCWRRRWRWWCWRRRRRWRGGGVWKGKGRVETRRYVGRTVQILQTMSNCTRWDGCNDRITQTISLGHGVKLRNTQKTQKYVVNKLATNQPPKISTMGRMPSPAWGVFQTKHGWCMAKSSSCLHAGAQIHLPPGIAHPSLRISPKFKEHFNNQTGNWTNKPWRFTDPSIFCNAIDDFT